MTPPASTEPMYLISESEIQEYCYLRASRNSGIYALHSEVKTLAKKYKDEFRARGPVAQQAPAQRYFPIASCYECANRMRMHELYKPYGMMILPEGKESTDFMGRWVCTEKDDQEIIGDEIPSWCPLSKGISSPDHDAALIAPEAPRNELAERECAINNCMRKDWLERHDAALITQEREKWERERTKKPGCYNSCPFDDLCANDIEKIQEIERMAAAQAREDVLDHLNMWLQRYPDATNVEEMALYGTITEKIKSLRSEVSK